MRILITGAAGFLGSTLLWALADRGANDDIVAVDRVAREPGPANRHRWVLGAFEERKVMDEVFHEDFDCVFHLASVPGGLAERDPTLGRRVNLDATLDLFDRLAALGGRPRVVFASSVAVYGDMPGVPVGSHSPTRPTTSYGAHKRMAEIALANFSRRGEVSGISLRLPGLIARPGRASGFGSAFMSELPRAYADGEPYLCPVSPLATAWWMSARCAARNLVHAAMIEHRGEVQLPALRLSVEQVVDALAANYGPRRRALITFAPDAQIEQLFGRFPDLFAAPEEELGFAHDGSAESLIKEALA